MPTILVALLICVSVLYLLISANSIHPIPDTVWAAVIASGITLLGVMLQGFQQERRFKRELEHNTNQREKDRQLKIRKEIYLEAARVLAGAQSFLSSFSKINKPLSEIELETPGLSESLNQMLVIASLDTIAAISEGQKFFLNAMFEIIIERIPIDKLTADLQIQTNKYHEAREARENKYQEIEKFVNSTSYIETVYSSMQSDYNSLIENEKQEYDKLIELDRHRKNVLLDFSTKLLARNLKLNQFVTNINIQIRKELEFPLDDIGKFQEIVTATNQSTSDAYNEFLIKIRQKQIELN